MLNKMSSSVKAGIFSGILASIFFAYFIDPIIKGIGKSVIYILQLLHHSYFDRLFAEIASGKPDYAHSMSFVFSIVAAYAAIDLIKIRIRGSLISSHVDASKKSKTYRYINASGWTFITVSLAFMGLFTMIDGTIRLRVLSSFEQHMTVVSPYIDEIDMKKLRSDFALMKSKADYDHIVNRLNNILSSTKVTRHVLYCHHGKNRRQENRSQEPRGNT